MGGGKSERLQVVGGEEEGGEEGEEEEGGEKGEEEGGGRSKGFAEVE